VGSRDRRERNPFEVVAGDHSGRVFLLRRHIGAFLSSSTFVSKLIIRTRLMFSSGEEMSISEIDYRPARAAAIPSGARTCRSPVQARSRETVERILAAAIELIEGSGVEATTTRATAPPRVLDLPVELGDRVLEMAFRDGPKADSEVVGIGRAVLVPYLEDWKTSGDVDPRGTGRKP
jgi:hypothetical protein